MYIPYFIKIIKYLFYLIKTSINSLSNPKNPLTKVINFITNILGTYMNIYYSQISPKHFVAVAKVLYYKQMHINL